MKTNSLMLRKPEEGDGGKIWDLVRRSGKLDLNSSYCYLMLGKYFANTCAVAELDGRMVGFVTGFRHPEKADTWFLWQIAVDETSQGKGIARRLIEDVLSREDNRNIQYVEATVSPSNVPSQSLFRSFARDRGLECVVTEGFASDLFPEGAHEDEQLYRIGPIH